MFICFSLCFYCNSTVQVAALFPERHVKERRVFPGNEFQTKMKIPCGLSQTVEWTFPIRSPERYVCLVLWGDKIESAKRERLQTMGS
jgi:hypothetical protein